MKPKPSNKIHSMNSSSSVMAPFFANQSCDPWTPQEQPCELGNYVRYAVNVTGPDDITAAIRFAREKNVRLVIRNTGTSTIEPEVVSNSSLGQSNYLSTNGEITN